MSIRPGSKAKALRHRVRCLRCNEVFDNDYVSRHTEAKHKDLAQERRLVQTIPVGAEMVKDPWSASSSTSKKRKLESDANSSVSKTLANVMNPKSMNDEMNEESMDNISVDVILVQESSSMDDVQSSDHSVSEGESSVENVSDGDEDANDPAGLDMTNDMKTSGKLVDNCV